MDKEISRFSSENELTWVPYMWNQLHQGEHTQKCPVSAHSSQLALDSDGLWVISYSPTTGCYNRPRVSLQDSPSLQTTGSSPRSCEPHAMLSCLSCELCGAWGLAAAIHGPRERIFPSPNVPRSLSLYVSPFRRPVSHLLVWLHLYLLLPLSEGKMRTFPLKKT